MLVVLATRPLECGQGKGSVTCGNVHLRNPNHKAVFNAADAWLSLVRDLLTVNRHLPPPSIVLYH